MLFNESITIFLNHLICSESKAKTTTVSYRTDLNQFYSFLNNKFRITKIEQVEHKHIIDFKDYLARQTQLKATSINRKLDCLKKYFGTMIKLKAISDNPMILISGVKFDRTAHCTEYLTPEELKTILYYIETLNGLNARRDRLLIKMLAYLGLRRTDCLNLNWANIDFISETVNFIGEKTAQSETQVLHKNLLSELKSYYNYVMPQDLKTPIFVSRESNRLSKTAFGKIITDVVKGCGIEKHFKITSKTFRHTFLTILVNEQGVDLLTAQRMAGHKDRRSIEYYVDTTKNQRRKAIDCFMADFEQAI